MEGRQLSCHMTYFKWSIAVPLLALIGGVYIGGLVRLLGNPSENAGAIVAWAVVGLAVVLLFPMFAASVRSTLEVGAEGIHERQRLFFSLFSREHMIPWGEVRCWNSSVAFLPFVPVGIPQIKLYTLRWTLRIEMSGKPFSDDNEGVTWGRFKEKLEAVLRSQAIPEATPEPAAMRNRTLRIAFVVVMILIGVLLVVWAVLSVTQGQVSYSVLVGATLMYFLLARSGARFLKR